MDQSQALLQQLQTQAGEERTLPAEVLKDVEDEKAQYEKDLLQGAGGLLAGNTVEKSFKLLTKGEKGKQALKRLGINDEDIDTIVNSIKSRDSGALTDFLARKGTGYAENLARKITGKTTKVVNTTAKALKEGRTPTRDELADAILDGGGNEVNPSLSNRSGGVLKDSEADSLDSQSGSVFDSLINKGKSAIKSTQESLENAVGDIPSQLSAQASRITSDARGVIRGAESSVRNPLSKANSAFDRARADFQASDDLEGQAQAVRNMLQQSKAGRRLLKRNAKARAEGSKTEKIPKQKRKTEFDDADADGDLLSEQINKVKAPKRVQPKSDEVPNEPVEIDAITGKPLLTPAERVAQARAKIDADAQAEFDRIQEEGFKDPYQDIYDQADRVAQRFTPQELGKPVAKTEVDFQYRPPTEAEHKAQLAEQEIKGETDPNLLPDLSELLAKSKSTAEAVETEAPREAIPPSQQTQGLDPSKLPDDAGYQRGSQKIQAKKEVDEPKPEPQPIDQETKPPQIQETDIEQAYQAREVEKPPEPEPQPVKQETVQDARQEQSQEAQQAKVQQENETLEHDSPATKPKSDLNSDDKLLSDGSEEASKASKIEDGLKGAFEDSLADDDNPFGIVVTGVLGLGALIGGFYKKAHHPTFVQPPALHPYESFSVQEGVA